MLIFIAYGLLTDRKHCSSVCCKTGECENWTVKLLPDLLDFKDSIWFCLQFCYKKKSPQKCEPGCLDQHFKGCSHWALLAFSVFFLPGKSSYSSDLMFLTIYFSFFPKKERQIPTALGKSLSQRRGQGFVLQTEMLGFDLF